MKTTNTTRSALVALLGTLVLLAPAAVPAQQAESRQSEPPAAAQDEDSTTDAAAEPEAADGEGGTEDTGVFIPTEEISEDYAVSFPVDI